MPSPLPLLVLHTDKTPTPLLVAGPINKYTKIHFPAVPSYFGMTASTLLLVARPINK